MQELKTAEVFLGLNLLDQVSRIQIEKPELRISISHE